MDDVRQVALDGGRALLVRPAHRDDVADLEHLYAGLDVEDRFRRFFSAYRPDRAFFEHMADAAARGDVQLVAVITQPDGRDELVGEAGYAVLPNGDGELAITVAKPWRGWLGPFLLDALVEAAAARGIPNLEADVLATNQPMLALTRARRAVRMKGCDWSIVRTLIATGAAARAGGACAPRQP
ncbi:MAG TPA: GNAT family N-acetyltransferase [Acidimicrobiales bacterium]|nr:GNAT family N-acetyltransferase [Acidimicrobiales bacterium]